MTATEPNLSAKTSRLQQLRRYRASSIIVSFTPLTLLAVFSALSIAERTYLRRHHQSAFMLSVLGFSATYLLVLAFISIRLQRLEMRELESASLADILESIDTLVLKSPPSVLFESSRWEGQLRNLTGIPLARAVRVSYNMLWRNIPDSPPADRQVVVRMTPLLRTVLNELRELGPEHQSSPEVKRLILKLELNLPVWEQALLTL